MEKTKYKTQSIFDDEDLFYAQNMKEVFVRQMIARLLNEIEIEKLEQFFNLQIENADKIFGKRKKVYTINIEL